MERTIVSLGTLKDWLADSSNGVDAICRLPDFQRNSSGPTWLQPLSSIVMDLSQLKMWVSDGPSCQNPYLEINF